MISHEDSWDRIGCFFTPPAEFENDFGKYRDWLSSCKVNIKEIKNIDSELTAFANIITDKGDNQIAAFYPGAMKYSCGISDNMTKDSIAIISPGNMDDMLNLIKKYQQENISYIFDPGQQIPALSKDALRDGIKGAKIFISNDYELSLVIKKTGWSEVEIQNNVEMLVTTLGEKGSTIKNKEKIYNIPPAKIEKIVDPTGAGDAYRAGFIKGLIAEWPLEKVGRFAGVVAAYAVEQQGTQVHEFNLKDVWERYEKNF